MTKAEAASLLKQHGGNKAAAARAAHMPVSTFGDRLRGREPGRARGEIAVDAKLTNGTVTGVRTISLNDAIAPHDKAGQTLRIVQSLGSGELMEDESLRKEINVGQTRWRSVR
ncbi:MAG TPA: hypothetical protein DCS05_09225, partial [Nitrospiraceae bacterium]|nr:hypothetical protein [Nitrospiraceae bacterium]